MISTHFLNFKPFQAENQKIYSFQLFAVNNDFFFFFIIIASKKFKLKNMYMLKKYNVGNLYQSHSEAKSCLNLIYKVLT